MELQDVVSSLTDEQKNVVLSAIEAEKTRGIDESRRKGAEAAKLRKEAEAYRTAIKNTFEVDVSNVDELPGVLSKFKTSTMDNSQYVPVKDFEFLKKQIAEEKALREASNRELRNSKTAEKLSKVIGDTFHASDYLIKDLIANERVRLTESGDVVFVDGDEEIEAVKGIEKLKKSRPDLVKNISKPGSGGAGGKENKGSKTISESEFMAMDGRTRAAKMAEGYTIST